MDVANILLAAQSPDPNARHQAEAVLTNACEKDFPVFVQTLVGHLANEAADAESRRLAGLILKNNVDAKDRNTRAQYHARWSNLNNDQLRPSIRALLLQTLKSAAPQPRRAAAQVISKIAAIELPVPGVWDALIEVLLASSTGAMSADHERQAALETLGYICEDAAYGEISAHVLTTHSNQILTAVVHGMTYKADQPPPSADQANENAVAEAQAAADVRLAATTALNNALEFARSQFEVENERRTIMETIYKSAKSPDNRIRQAAFECLVKVGEHYYDKLPEYIQWLYELTEASIKSDIEPVALQGIEFWSTIAEEEIALMDEAEASREMGVTAERTSQNFVATALPFLNMSILACLKQQEEDPLDDQTWNRATAAGSCLELLAQAAPAQILELVMPFVEANIGDKENWRSREAAILAFGSVLDGPPVDNVKTLVMSAFPVLMSTLLHDPVIAVRDTAAWTIGRVVQVDATTTVAHLAPLVECLRSALTQATVPVLAAHVCYAIHNLAECFVDEADNPTGPLRDHAELLLRALLVATTREDADESHLRTTAYEALNMMLRAVSKDCIVFIQSCLPMLLEKLEASIVELRSGELSENDAADVIECQGLLCGTMTTATQRLQGTPGWDGFADRMMAAYLSVLTLTQSAAVHEEALLAIGAVADAAGPNFNKYMSHLMEPLTFALGNHEHYQVCAVATAVVGDVCRAIGVNIMHWADNIVYRLLEALQSSSLDRSVKPPILSCFGDIALATGGQFEKYLPQVMARMQQAAESSIRVDVALDDYDMQDWLLALRESIFEAYIGIINGLRDDEKEHLLEPFVEWLLQFCQVVVSPESPTGQVGSELLTKAAAGVLGDLVGALPKIKDQLRQRAWIAQLLERGGQSKDLRTRETSNYASQTIFSV